MFAAFVTEGDVVTITIDKKNSWDAAHHEIVLNDAADSFLGLSYEDFKHKKTGNLSIELNEMLRRKDVLPIDINLKAALRNGEGLNCWFFDQRNPEHLAHFIVT